MTDQFWDALDADLARYPARPVLDHVPARSSAEYTGYDVRLSGLDSYRLFGYLSVPTGPGPFPALLELPRYGSVNHPPHHNERVRYTVFTIMHRGQRRADAPFVAAYPGLFAHGATDPQRYVYRAIVADCLRAAEFLAGRPDVDPARIGVTGDDLALLTAARRPWFAAVRVSGPLLHDAVPRSRRTESHPAAELADHLRRHPDDEEAIAATLARFDPVGHPVTTPTLLVDPGDHAWRDDLAARHRIHPLTGRDATDNDALDAWLAARLGVPPMARFVVRPDPTVPAAR